MKVTQAVWNVRNHVISTFIFVENTLSSTGHWKTNHNLKKYLLCFLIICSHSFKQFVPHVRLPLLERVIESQTGKSLTFYISIESNYQTNQL